MKLLKLTEMFFLQIVTLCSKLLKCTLNIVYSANSNILWRDFILLHIALLSHFPAKLHNFADNRFIYPYCYKNIQYSYGFNTFRNINLSIDSIFLVCFIAGKLGFNFPHASQIFPWVTLFSSPETRKAIEYKVVKFLRLSNSFA